MTSDQHTFIHNYEGLGAFGLNRHTDEETIMFYLQKFSEDRFMETFIPRLTDQELELVYNTINSLLQQHITEDEYHELFLKDR